VGWHDRNTVTVSLLAIALFACVVFIVVSYYCFLITIPLYTDGVHTSDWQYRYDDITTRCRVVLRNLENVSAP